MKYIGGYYRTVLDHYQFAGEHMKNQRGYEYYAKMNEKLAVYGDQKAIEFFADLQVYGTPEQVYEKIMTIHKQTNNSAYVGVFSYAGMPHEEAARNMRLFASDGDAGTEEVRRRRRDRPRRSRCPTCASPRPRRSKSALPKERAGMNKSLAVIAMAVTLGVWSDAVAQPAFERGKYLVESIAGCGNCHTPQGPNGPLSGKTLAGGLEFAHPGFFTAYSTNITPDPETGIGKWTDAQLKVAIREAGGDGTAIRPTMPFEFYRGERKGELIAGKMRLVSRGAGTILFEING